ncbi:MAG: cell division protein ZapA [Angelakisella sp.]|jgi:cell division protein ZapA|nr:cell division protein ZapA [Angelakisella sp.]
MRKQKRKKGSDSMATRSKVKVLGTTYYITTSGSEDQVRRIEEQMNDQLAAILEQRPSLSTLDALVILSLNLMDEITDAENSTDRMREQLSQYLEDAAKARMELEDERRQRERAVQELADEKRLCSQFRQELEKQKRQFDRARMELSRLGLDEDDEEQK